MSQTYLILMSTRNRYQLRKRAAACDTSTTALVRHIAFMPWRKTDITPVTDFIRIGARGSGIEMPLADDVLAAYKKLARDFFVVSNTGSRDFVGAVLEAWILGYIEPDGAIEVPKILPRMTPKGTYPSVALSRRALQGIQLRQVNGQNGVFMEDRAEKQLAPSLVRWSLHLKPEDFFIREDLQGEPRQRRWRHIELPPTTITRFADLARKLGLPVPRAYSVASAAAAFLEDYGTGRIVYKPSGPNLVSVDGNDALTDSDAPGSGTQVHAG